MLIHPFMFTTYVCSEQCLILDSGFLFPNGRSEVKVTTLVPLHMIYHQTLASPQRPPLCAADTHIMLNWGLMYAARNNNNTWS